MRFQDWRIPQLIEGALRAYHRAGRAVTPMMHSLEVDLGNLAAGAVSAAPVILSIAAEGDFLWLGCASAVATGGGTTLAAAPVSAFSVRIALASSGEGYGKSILRAGESFDRWLPVGAIAGTGALPHFFPWPVLLRREDVLTIEGSNQSGAAARVWLTLIGAKLVGQAA